MQLYHAVCNGNLVQADQLRQTLIDLFPIFRISGVWGAFEVALRYLAICEKVTIKPFALITDATIEAQIRQILKTYVPGPTPLPG